MKELSTIESFLDLEQKREFEENTTMMTYRKGQTLTIQGAPIYGVYQIINGVVKTSKISKKGVEIIQDINFPGDYIGYNEVIVDEKSPFVSTACSFVKVRFIDSRFFKRLISENFRISTYFMQKASSNLLKSTDNECYLKCTNAKAKVRKALELLNEKYKNVGHEQFELSRSELASYAGVATETCIRLLSVLKKEEVVEVEGRMIKVIA